MRILICIDVGESAEIVLREAKKFLKGFPDSTIDVLNVMDISAIAFGEGYDALFTRSMELQAEDLKNTAASIFGDIPFHFSAETGYPTDEIIRKANGIGCELLILGTHGRTGFNHLLIGSVAEKTLRLAECNTLIIPVKRKPQA